MLLNNAYSTIKIISEKQKGKNLLVFISFTDTEIKLDSCDVKRLAQHKS